MRKRPRRRVDKSAVACYLYRVSTKTLLADIGKLAKRAGVRVVFPDYRATSIDANAVSILTNGKRDPLTGFRVVWYGGSAHHVRENERLILVDAFVSRNW